MAAVFSHGDLRLYLLALLEERPLHGYGIMQALSERTGGTYTPSAGTIYPRLAKLEEEGLVTKTQDGRTAVYAITDAGRAEVSGRAEEIAGIQDGLSDSVRIIADGVRQNVREAMKSLRAELAAAGAAPADDEPPAADPRGAARAQQARAEAALSTFRATLRADLRTHVARGGALAPELVDALQRDLDGVVARARAALGR
ncbi:PadR family transcriptional regulator [Microbacterium excoecariae]|uniref:PadR family transcriptional regulator n=1 Tax=Microbacterium excoecariae TaxID=2715210 RepID=UPI00140A61F1|nr:PadR family transcriptional regulator [Microbacterium excoecariae]NHI16185.1 helix-turn-helix transcriptional regulator [Microbacterium excoecariae]